MICPFRKEVITIKAEDTESIKEIYCDCYEDECPYYVPKKYTGEVQRCRKAEE